MDIRASKKKRRNDDRKRRRSFDMDLMIRNKRLTLSNVFLPRSVDVNFRDFVSIFVQITQHLLTSKLSATSCINDIFFMFMFSII